MAKEETCCRNGWYKPVAIIIAALLLAGAIFLGAQAQKAVSFTANQNPNEKTISVQGTAIQDVNPDKVEIVFAINTKGTDPDAIQKENDATMRTIVDKLKALGIPEENIKTVSYNLDRYSEWNDSQKTTVDMGYQLSNSVRVVSYDVTQAGTVVKTVVANGANDVSGVTFGLADATRDRVYAQLLSKATKQAGDKAQSMASAAGIGIKGIASISENYGYYQPYANVNYRLASDVSQGAAPSNVMVSPGTVQLTANVNAAYEIN